MVPTSEVKQKCKAFIDEASTILETLRYDFFKEEKVEQALLDFPVQQKPISIIGEKVSKSIQKCFSLKKSNWEKTNQGNGFIQGVFEN